MTAHTHHFQVFSSLYDNNSILAYQKSSRSRICNGQKNINSLHCWSSGIAAAFHWQRCFFLGRKQSRRESSLCRFKLCKQSFRRRISVWMILAQCLQMNLSGTRPRTSPACRNKITTNLVVTVLGRLATMGMGMHSALPIDATTATTNLTGLGRSASAIGEHHRHPSFRAHSRTPKCRWHLTWSPWDKYNFDT